MRKITQYITCLYMIMTISFPDKPQITQPITGILAICFILLLLETGKVTLTNASIVAVWGYVLWMGVSITWSPDLQLGFFAFWRLTVVVLFMTIVCLTVKSIDELAVLLQSYVIAVVIVFVSLYKNILSGNGAWSAGEGDQMRYSADGIQPNAIGWLMAMGVGVAWLLIILNRKNVKFFYLLNCCVPVLCIVGVVGSGSRSGAVAMAFTLIPVLLFFIKRPTSAVIFLLLGCFMLPSFLASPKIQGSLSRILNAGSSFQNDQFSGRINLWQAGVEIASAKPILGTGAGGFNAASSELALNTTSSGLSGPHNFILSLLSDTGIVGLTLYLVFLYTIIKSLRLIPRQIRLVCLGIFAALISILLQAHEQFALTTLYPFLLIILCGQNCKVVVDQDLDAQPHKPPARNRIQILNDQAIQKRQSGTIFTGFVLPSRFISSRSQGNLRSGVRNDV